MWELQLELSKLYTISRLLSAYDSTVGSARNASNSATGTMLKRKILGRGHQMLGSEAKAGKRTNNKKDTQGPEDAMEVGEALL